MSQRSDSSMRLYDGMRFRPFRMIPKMYPSLHFTAAAEPAPIEGGNIPYLMTTPLPLPCGPWQTAQLIWYSLRPRSIDAESAATGFDSDDMSSSACGVRGYMNSGAAVP